MCWHSTCKLSLPQSTFKVSFKNKNVFTASVHCQHLSSNTLWYVSFRWKHWDRHGSTHADSRVKRFHCSTKWCDYHTGSISRHARCIEYPRQHALDLQLSIITLTICWRCSVPFHRSNFVCSRCGHCQSNRFILKSFWIQRKFIVLFLKFVLILMKSRISRWMISIIHHTP